MSESDLSASVEPANDTALSLADGAAAIEGLLGARESDHADKTESQPKGQDKPEPAPQAETQPQAEASDDDDLDLEDEAIPENENGPDEPATKGGQFAADSAKVTLPDGRVTTVAELKRNTLFQKDYSQKTEALAKERDTFQQERQAHQQERQQFDTQRNQFADAIKQIQTERNLILTVANEILPKEPEPVDPNVDPIGYMNYMRDRDAYLQTMGRLQTLWNNNQQQMQAAQHQQAQLTEAQQKEQQAQASNFVNGEFEKLFSKQPTLKDKAAWDGFVNEAHSYGQKYWDLAPEIMNSVPYHGFILMAQDAIKYRKALEKKAAGNVPLPVQQQQQAQTPRVAQRQRMTQTPEARGNAEAIDRLRKTGSINDAAKALERFVQ
jgi:hypothetical protein